ncbi:MAG: sigma-70 family RNA polymerase sigma factor [Oscillospiraceae bacterium]
MDGVRDEEWRELLCGNPEKGLKALMKQYGGLVYAVVKRCLPEFCEADVEECAAGVFSEFYLELEKYDPSKGSIKAWLCVIARHNALDFARKNLQSLPLEEEIAVSETTLESNLEEYELRKAVLEAVKSLGEPDREILLRKFYLGESSKQIAAHLKMSVSNVDVRTSRAVDKLRKNLKDWGE